MAHMTPHIRISPFLPNEWDKLILKPISKKAPHEALTPGFWLDGASGLETFDSGRAALEHCLKRCGLKKNEEVLIVTTTQGPYISSCVTKTIEKVCRWSRQLTNKTRAALIIHEFGFPCPKTLVAPLIKKGLPIIEDCAYAIGSRINGAEVGRYGDYAIYSLTKYYPIPFGGLLISKEKNKTSAHHLTADDEKLLRLTIKNSAPLYHQWNKARQDNWNFFAGRLRPYQITPYFQRDHGVVPGVFLAKLPKGFPAAQKKERLNQAGVESTQYYGQGGFYFPAHQFLTDYEKEYILYHFLK